MIAHNDLNVSERHEYREWNIIVRECQVASQSSDGRTVRMNLLVCHLCKGVWGMCS